MRVPQCSRRPEVRLSPTELRATVFCAAFRLTRFLEHASLGIPRQSRLNNLHLLSGNDGIGGIDNDLVVRLEAGDDFYLIAEIVPRSHGSKCDFVILHNAYTQTLRTEYQGVDGNDKRGSLSGNFQVDFGIRTCEQGVCWIGHINLNQQSASGHVDRLRGAYQLSLKRAPRKFRECKIRGHADIDPARICFRNIYVNAQRSGLSDAKQISFYV